MYSQIIIIPAYEPDQRLIRYVDQLLHAGFEKLIIVDDGSSTECQEIFRQIQVKNMEGGKVTLLHHPKNRGKGAALKTGILHGQRIYGKGNTYITVDSDGQHLVKDVIAVAKEMQAAPDALVLGCRDFSGRDVPWRSRFGNRITSKFFYLMNGKKVPDTQTGLRGIPENLVDLALSEEGTRYEYEMDFLSDGVAVGHYRHIACNDRRDAGFVCRIHYFVHYGNVLAVNYGIDREIGFYAVLVACGSDFAQVVDGECTCGTGAHVQLPDAEIHGVGSSLNGSRQAFP